MTASLEKFEAVGVATVNFPFQRLRKLQRLYWQIYADELPSDIKMGLKLHEEGDEFQSTTMRWFFANSEAAISYFRNVLDDCGGTHIQQIIGNDANLVRVVQANLIELRGGYPIGKWHTDFTDENIQAGTTLTVLTPLFEFSPHFGGLETTSAKRSEPEKYDLLSSVYRYQSGEAVIFDGATTIHRTQSYKAEPNDRRVLVSWQLANCQSELIPMLDRIAKRNGDPMFYSAHISVA